MKTQYYTASSLDGFIATEDDSLEWLFPLADLNGSSYPDFIAGVGALAMESVTYGVNGVIHDKFSQAENGDFPSRYKS